MQKLKDIPLYRKINQIYHERVLTWPNADCEFKGGTVWLILHFNSSREYSRYTNWNVNRDLTRFTGSGSPTVVCSRVWYSLAACHKVSSPLHCRHCTSYLETLKTVLDRAKGMNIDQNGRICIQCVWKKKRHRLSKVVKIYLTRLE